MDERYMLENTKETSEIEDIFRYNIHVHENKDKLFQHKKLYHISEYALYKLERLLA